MTNNTAVKTESEVRSMKRDELRKYATSLGLKNVNKLSRDNLNIVVLNKLAEMTPQHTKVRTSHADCAHASSKSARAKCRRERAAQNSTTDTRAIESAESASAEELAEYARLVTEIESE